MSILRQILVLLVVAFALALATVVKPIAAKAATAKPRTLQASTALTKRVVTYAKRFVGVPYVYGGSSPRGFDCSGLTTYVYKHFGIGLPRTTYSQIGAGHRVARNHLRPGDLLFFGTGHVGMYVGNGRFIHAPRSGTRVRIESLRGWYGHRLSAARRIATR
jgi:peptidoglycan DL-endopeptidase CwlO